MDDDKKDLKKNFPNGFVWFLMAAFFLAFMVQNFIDTKFAKVAFSYQLEHLVNLQLIQPEDSRKTALNDNLVTFSGKFREKETDEGKNRFKYLSLLHSNHDLVADKEHLESELAIHRNKVVDAAEWYLALTGVKVPPEGYVVVDESLPTEKNYSITISQQPQKSVVSLLDLEKQLAALQAAPTDQGVIDYGKTLQVFVQSVRSPILGIGNEQIKEQLRGIEAKLLSQQTSKEKDAIALYAGVTEELKTLLASINTNEGGAFDAAAKCAQL